MIAHECMACDFGISLDAYEAGPKVCPYCGGPMRQRELPESQMEPVNPEGDEA